MKLSLQPAKKAFAAAICAALVASLFLLGGCGAESTAKDDEPKFSVSDLQATNRKAVGSSSFETENSTGTLSAEEARELSRQTLTDLMEEIDAIAVGSGMTVSVSLIDLSTGLRAEYQAEKQMVAGSMVKLLVAYAFLEQVDKGRFSLDSVYTIKQGDLTDTSGPLYELGVGGHVTYRELIQYMISQDDDISANALIEMLGMDAINATATELELNATKLNRYLLDENAASHGIENYVSANDVAKLLRMAYRGQFVSEDASQLVLDALAAQEDEYGLADGFPEETSFAHKTASLEIVKHDGGIVDGDSPFVLVVLCGGSGYSESAAFSTLSEIAAATYSAFYPDGVADDDNSRIEVNVEVNSSAS